MSAAGEGGATGTTTSSYGGGAAGGKFRKKPFRRQTTPYDRPQTHNDGSWLKKFVVDSASKFISYGANRFFASVFQKRLTPAPPPQPEVNRDVIEELQGMIPSEQPGDECSQQIITSSSNQRISELEQILKQKTFTRSEVDHLTGLLQSRAVEASLADEHRNNKETASDFGKLQQFACGPTNEIGNEGIRFHGVASTPIFSSKVIEDNTASPTELAKAYMGKQPSNVSPPMLGKFSRVDMKDTLLLSSMAFPSKSPGTTKTSVRFGAPENGFITPRSRGRSAIYNMVRTPYSRVPLTSILKGGGYSNNDYVGPSMTSSSLSLVEHKEKFRSNSKSMTLKRRSSVLDDEVGYVSSTRRIRPKSNLLAPRISPNANGLGIGSAKQKLSLIGHPMNVSTADGKDENESCPSTSYARVLSKSSEVAARIFQHLENITPVEKSSDSKFQDKAFKLKPSMLRGRTLTSTEDMDSFELPLDVQDDHKLQDGSIVDPDSHDSVSQKQAIVEENGPNESLVLSGTWNSAKTNDFAVSLKESPPSTPIQDYVGRNCASQPSQKKSSFRMSVQEDFFELDDDFKGRGPTKVSLVDTNLASAIDPKLVNTTTQPEVKSTSGLELSRTIGSAGPGSVKFVGDSNGIASASAETRATSQSPFHSQSAAADDKPKEANSSRLFSFSTKVSDKFPSLLLESSSKIPESKPEGSNSSINISVPTSQLKAGESDKGGNDKPLNFANGFGKSDSTTSAASDGPFVLKPPTIAFTAGSFNVTNQISAGGAQCSTFPTNTLNFASTSSGTSTSTTTIGSIFEASISPATSTAPVLTFSASIEPSTAVSAPSTTKISEVADLPTNSEKDKSSGSSNIAGSGSSIFGLNAPVNHSIAKNLQGFLFNNNENKSVTPATGSAPQAASVDSVPFPSLPPFTMNSSTSFGSTTFGFSSSASSSDANKSMTNASSTALPNSSTVNRSSTSPGGIFSVGLSSSSSSTSAVGLTSGPPVFSFGISSSASASVNSTSSSPSGASGIFNFGGSSATPDPAINVSSSSSSNGIFNFGGSSPATSVINPSSSGIFSFSGNSSASLANSSASAPSNVFGSSWQSPKSSMFGSVSSSPSPSTGFVFGSPAPTNAAPMFPFSASSALSTPSQAQPAFGNFGSGFGTSPGKNDQMNGEDSMAEDNPVQQSTTPVFGQQVSTAPLFGQQPVSPAPVFGQQVSPSPIGFLFGQTVPTQANPFQFNTQQNQVNPNPFQASGSLEFNAGGSFSLGSGGGDKSGRRTVKVNRSRHRKK